MNAKQQIQELLYEEKRKELLCTLKELGVKSPARLYPKTSIWQYPPQMVLEKMEMHVVDLEMLKAYEKSAKLASLE